VALQPADGRAPRALKSWPWVVGALIIGVLAGGAAGWIVRGHRGTATTTVTARAAVTAPSPAARARRAAAAQRTARARVRLVILNGTSITGLAARTASRAHRLGYRTITVGNGPRVGGTSLVYFRRTSHAIAERVARDLKAAAPRRLPSRSPLIAQAPRGMVFVLLGPHAASRR
jgi:hypothetical protein